MYWVLHNNARELTPLRPVQATYTEEPEARLLYEPFYVLTFAFLRRCSCCMQRTGSCGAGQTRGAPVGALVRADGTGVARRQAGGGMFARTTNVWNIKQRSLSMDGHSYVRFMGERLISE